MTEFGKIAFWTLGCSKNTYDSEELISLVDRSGYEIVELDSSPNVVILNTCGFIDEAKEQSIDAILECCELKNSGGVEMVVAMGCLTQRYRDEIQENIPELDGIFGVGEFEKMLSFCSENLIADPNHVCAYDPTKKSSLTPPHWTYLKISDGCSNGCTFCAIPKMKGLLLDKTKSAILDEVKWKLQRGVKEFNIIGQDPTHFGLDNSGDQFLELLKEICAIEGDFWVRVLYAYPGHVSSGLIDFIAENPKMVNYIDMPMQHANTYMLKRMGRAHTQKKMNAILESAWQRKERVHVRSTVIVGFPGEKEEHFADLLDFISKNKFDRLGAFSYSPEDGTPAAGFPDMVDEDETRERLSRFEEVQGQITEELSLERIGQVERVIVDQKRDDLGEGWFEVRSQAEAPEVDILVLMQSPSAKVGDWAQVQFTKFENGELYVKEFV